MSLLTLVYYGLTLFLLVVLILRILDQRRCASTECMIGKVVLITGASSGIGKETARDLAKRGARVIMACRNLTKANRVADDIRKDAGNELVEARQLDISSLATVRSFAREFLKTEKRLDVLILNAGIGAPPSLTYTKENLELTMATNYFGHFLLTNLLLGLLKTSSPSRVVVVSSHLHRSVGTVNVQTLNSPEEKNYKRRPTYALSKICNVLFALQLSQLLKHDDVTVNSLCPGFVHTEIMKKMKGITYKIKDFVSSIIAKNEVQGAQTTIYLAVSQELEGFSGEFFENCEMSQASKLASNIGLAKKLWEKTEDIVKLEEHEKHY